jgi:hypothetical protein
MTGTMDADRTILGIAGFAVVALMLPAVASPSCTQRRRRVRPRRSSPTCALPSLVLASVFLSALGWGGVLLVFASCALRRPPRARGWHRRLAHVASVGCAATAVAILTALTFVGVVAYRAPAIDPETASVLYDRWRRREPHDAFPNAIYVDRERHRDCADVRLPALDRARCSSRRGDSSRLGRVLGARGRFRTVGRPTERRRRSRTPPGSPRLAAVSRAYARR